MVSKQRRLIFVVANTKYRDETLSHIMTGYIDNSPAKGIVRVNEAYDDAPASSLFNYANVTKDGLVDNILTIYNGTEPYVWQGYVNSNYPIFEKDFLVKAEAVFGGLVKRQFEDGDVASVSNLLCCNLIVPLGG